MTMPTTFLIFFCIQTMSLIGILLLLLRRSSRQTEPENLTRKALNQTTQRALEEPLDALMQSLHKEVGRYMAQYKKDIADQHLRFVDTAQEQLSAFSKELHEKSSHLLLSYTHKLKDDFEQTLTSNRAELETYKNEQIKKVDAASDALIMDVASKKIRSSIPRADQHAFAKEAIEALIQSGEVQ